jgi:peptide deformylase
LRLVLYPEPILLRPAPPIAEITDDVRARAAEMVPFMQLEGGIGLAAPQVGWAARVLVASEDGDPAKAQTLVNPEIVWKGGGQEWDEEGCLSFPGIYGEVRRAKQVRVKALDLAGKELIVEGADLFARVLQHEIDHLDGVLFITKMRPADKAANKARLMDLVRRYEEPAATDPLR